MNVQEIVTRNAHGAQVTDSVQSAALQMRRHNVGALPVFDVERLAGMITDRDITTQCVAGGHSPADCSVREHMTAEAITIDGDASVEEALAAMASEQVRRLVVTTGGAVAGIVSLGDLAVHLPGSPEVALALAEISQPIRVPTG